MVNRQTQLEAVFSALADPTRRRIVEKLARRARTVGEIASGFAISAPAISKHLRILEESGLLERQVIGRVHHCRLVPKTMRIATTWLERQQRYWNTALDNLNDYLERSDGGDVAP